MLGPSLARVADEDEPTSGQDPRDTGIAWTTQIWLRQGRGLEFDRLAFFSDAVFAIAITLVAVEIGVPEIEDSESPVQLWAAFRQDLPTIVAFFISFAVLAGYWLANHRFISALRAYDGRYRAWTMVYLAAVAFLPYPAATFGRYPDNGVAVALFAAAASAVSTLEAALFWSAYRGGLFTRAMSRRQALEAMVGSLTPVAVFALSIPVAIAVDPLAGIAVWFLSPALGAVQSRVTR